MTETFDLGALLPELAAIRREPPDKKQRCNRFEHTLKAFSEIENLLADPRTVMPCDIDPVVWSLASIPAAILNCFIDQTLASLICRSGLGK